MGDPVAASPEERVAALTRILDAMDEGDQGRRAFRAWLAEFLLKQPSQPG